MRMALAASLQCPLCSQPNFSSIDSLRSSLINVTNRPLACPICHEIQLGLDKLTIHLLSHTIIKSQPFDDKCIVVPSMHSNSVDRATECIMSQTTTEINSPFIGLVPDCQFCGCTFRTTEMRRMHMKLVHELFIDSPTSSNDSTHFQCNQCAKRFKMEGSLQLHCRMVHGRLSAGVRRIEKRLPMPQKQNKSNVRTNDCETSPAPNFHSNDGSSNSSKECTTASTSTSGANEEKTFDCTTCGKTFTTKYFLKKHKRLHTGEMPYVCEICNRTFTFQQSYHRHLSYHTDDRPHVCSVCGRAFKELSTLHNHERIHSGEKPWKCESCEKCFRQRISYLVHRRIHTGALPYECKTCDKKFRYKISLRTHKCNGGVSIVHDIQPTTTAPPSTTVDIEQSLPAVDDLLNLDCAQALDEFVTESYNRMGIVDHSEPPIGNHTDVTLLPNGYFNYAIPTVPPLTQPNHVHQPFGNSTNGTSLPSMQEFLATASHQQSTIDAMNEFFLCHDEY